MEEVEALEIELEKTKNQEDLLMRRIGFLENTIQNLNS